MSFDFRNLKPYVRYSYINTSVRAANIYTKPLYAYDHRLFYVMEGNITLSLENIGDYALAEGDCIMFVPSAGYRVLFDEVPSKFVITSFDFDEKSYGQKSRHPDVAHSYNKNNIFSEYHPCVFDKVHIVRGAFSLANTVTDMCKVMSGDSESKFDYASALMKAVLIEIARIDEEKHVLSSSSDISERVKNYIDSRFTENITNSHIGSRFGYHSYHINRIFKMSTGMTIHSYIIKKRISMSKSLLVNSRLSPCEIAELCGFSSTSYFCECFKKENGISAGAYRKQHDAQ